MDDTPEQAAPPIAEDTTPIAEQPAATVDPSAPAVEPGGTLDTPEVAEQSASQSASAAEVDRLALFLITHFSHQIGKGGGPAGESAVDVAIRLLGVPSEADSQDEAPKPIPAARHEDEAFARCRDIIENLLGPDAVRRNVVDRLRSRFYGLE